MTTTDIPRCPVHGQTDCSVLLNGCNRVNQMVAAAGRVVTAADTSLTAVADRLTRAADRIEHEHRRATSRGLLYAEHAAGEPVVRHGPTTDRIASFRYPGDADWFALFQPGTAIALVPLLRRAARNVERTGKDGARLWEWERDLDAFARRLLGEEESGG